MTTPTLATVELQLAGWTVSHNNGAKIAFFIDEAELEPFRNLTVRAGKTAGQRLMAVFVLIGDDEQPVATDKPKGGALSILAAQWCRETAFQGWLSKRWPELWAEYNPDLGVPREGAAKGVVCRVCGVNSRAEIDHNPDAKRAFNELIREPYRDYLAGCEA